MANYDRHHYGLKVLAVLFGLLLIFIGVVLLLRPNTLLAMMTLGFFAIGIFQLYRYFADDSGLRSGFTLACGLINLLFGVLAVLNTAHLMVVFTITVFWIAIWSIIEGCLRMAAAMRIRSLSRGGFGWVFFGGLLGVLLGAFLILFPQLSSVAVEMATSIAIGAMLIIYGITLVGNGFVTFRR